MHVLDRLMADDKETGSLLDTKLPSDSSSLPPPYPVIQSKSPLASSRNGRPQKCAPSSPVTTSSAVVRAPLLDDRVVSAVMRSVPPLERAFSVPDSHDSYVNVAVTIDDHGCTSRAGRGSLKAATRRCDSARSARSAVLATVAADNGVEQTDSVTAGRTTTRRRREIPHHSFSSVHRVGSSSSVNLSRKSYERLTGLELPPTPTPLPNDAPITPDTPIVITVATSATLTSCRPHGSTPAVRNCVHQPRTSQQPGHLPSLLPTIKMDENNVPQIDVAITPTSEYFGEGGQTSMFTLGAPPAPRRRRSGSPSNRPRRHGVADGVGAGLVSAVTPSMQVPMLTVTHDVDDDSLISDYITPSPFSFSGRDVDRLANPFANLGDDISLYGTPKEEMAPFRELDASSRRISSSPTNYLRDQIVSFFQPSDNKLAMKLFGNKNALMKEKLRQKAAGNWVIHPCSNFRLYSYYLCCRTYTSTPYLGKPGSL